VERSCYGTTAYGGVKDRGTAFQLTPNANGGWKEKLLHQFPDATDGKLPGAGLIFDDAGNLYGTTIYGGDLGDCVANGPGCVVVVFKLVPNSKGGWSETVLHRFFGIGSRMVARSGPELAHL
jgi:hypothetical protein